MSSYSKKAQVVYFFVCVAYLLLFCQRIFAHLLYLPASYTSYQITVIRERERERERGEGGEIKEETDKEQKRDVE